ncbi:gamma-glutamyltransferase family protein [Jiella mangrovi]|uniref:Gamma-glutamyltransferase n=1 Tax=Jiella mangrovi TaxID=2821407 RepID=A0ABS4BJQ7_9HYPH|nr:gamma-glutamyltransferase [Jiella mangrovi]MBP0616992.1 gamma-glutamyltransferase [Jiella mangrovi]
METWTIHKPAVTSAGGIVSAQNREAAEAGARILADGGNAVDAAVVTALVLSTVEPWLSGIGGGGFLVHAEPDGRVETLDFNVRASRHLDPEDYPLVGGSGGDWFQWPAVAEDRNIIGYASICVPGTIDGLATALAERGTISWAEALRPAIAFAERGMEVDWFSELCLAIDAANLAAFPTSSELFLDKGRAPKTPALGGARYRPMAAKARVLRRLAEAGPRDFYEGETARLLVNDLEAGGSKIAADDLAAYRCRWGEPARIDYRGSIVNTMAGLSGGPSLVAALGVLREILDPSGKPGGRAALAYATAIRDTYRNRLTTMGHAGKTGDCTTHISVVDRHGRMVSLTNTLLSRFGSKVALPQTGFLMNNGMMWFDPRPGVPNAIAPGATPLANMAPVVVTRDGRPQLAIGAAGGRQIFPTLVQLLSYGLDFGMSLENAFHHPRLDASTPTIRVNRAAAADVAAEVAKGYAVEIVDDTLYPVNFAIPSAVARNWTNDTNSAMAHPTSPWAAAVAQEEAAP